MKVVILGGGAVGTLVARRLISEKNEVTIVERDDSRCNQLTETLDAKIVLGSASSVTALEKADIRHADMLIAVTNSDDVNLLGCLITQAHSPATIKVARLRTHEVDRWQSICGRDFLDIDLVIHPDRETAGRILRVLEYPGVSHLLEFADGAVKLFGMSIDQGSWMVGKTLAELDTANSSGSSLVAMLLRGQKMIIPTGRDTLQAGDHAYILVPAAQLERTMEFMGIGDNQRVNRVFIVGGKQLGIEVALQLEKEGVQVKLFERDLVRCHRIATVVQDTLVVNGDGTDQGLLLEENIEGIDAYLALTGDDEVNIIASMLAKRLGARKVAALVNRLEFLPMARLLGISSTFSSRLAVVDRILQFVRKGRVLSVTTFQGEQAEAIELEAGPESLFAGRKLRNAGFPKNSIVGAIRRSSGEVLVPRGDDVINPGDRVIFFCLEHVVPELEAELISGR